MVAADDKTYAGLYVLECVGERDESLYGVLLASVGHLPVTHRPPPPAAGTGDHALSYPGSSPEN